MYCENWNLDAEKKMVGGNKEQLKVWEKIQF